LYQMPALSHMASGQLVMSLLSFHLEPPFGHG